MTILLTTPSIDQLDAAYVALREWQHEGEPMQFHSGDLGWNGQFGAEATAAALRTWSRDGQVLAVGLLDSADLLRMTVSPAALREEELARQVVEDLSQVLAAGRVAVEVPRSTLVRELLAGRGWLPDDPWTPLRYDLSTAVPSAGLRIEVADPSTADVRIAVHRASFDRSTFSRERWDAMASGAAYTDARCLIGYDDEDNAVAAVTVWSAGPGKPGLLEPLGVHRDHRGRGHGVAISRAAAADLQARGSSSARVCTPSSNVGAVATYRAAGFEQLDEVCDLYRPTG